jgi:two-component system, chemotaxis family, sensor kinase CheA
MIDELIEQFLIEGRELVARANDDLLALEAHPDDLASIDSAFRAVHTLKGSAGLFDLVPFVAMLHAAEDLVDVVRNGDLALDPPILRLLLACISQTERWLDAIAATGGLPADAEASGRFLTNALRAAQPLRTSVPNPPEDFSPSTDDDWIDTLLDRSTTPAGYAGALTAIRYIPDAGCFFRGDDPVAIAKETPGLAGLRISAREPWLHCACYDPFACNLIIDALSTAPADEVRAAYRLAAAQLQIVEVARQRVISEPVTAAGSVSRTLRIDAERIDALADIIDELVVAKNGLSQLAAEAQTGAAGQALARGILENQNHLGRLLASLHSAVTRVRLVPLAPVLRRLPRLARDIADKLGKDVDFSIQCEDVEVDKSIADGISDPLLHIVRNAIDHGVEAAGLRTETGKSSRGSVRLIARRTGDQIIVEVSDDGPGLDPARIRQAARDRAVLSYEAAGALSDAEAIDLIFAPGFSTAARVSDISGRGVGMDAVRVGVNRLGGRVTVDSNLGRGATVRLTLPLAVVMARVAIVASAGERFGVAMDAVVEIALVAGHRIVQIRGGRAFAMRDRVVPLFNLSDLLGRSGGGARPQGDMKVIVIQAREGLAGVAVDGFLDRLDILLRPLKGLLAGMRGVAGTTLLGDGSVLLVLDLPELIG